MNNIKKTAGSISIVLSVVSAFCSHKTIKIMHDGYIVFLDKLYGAQNYDIAQVNTFVMFSGILAAVLALSLIFLGIVLIRAKSSKRQIVEAAVLVLFVLFGNAAYSRFAAPTKLLIAIAKGETSENIIKLAGKSCNNINAVREGHTALTFAISNKLETSVIKALVENGANTNAKIPETGDPAFVIFLTEISAEPAKNEEDKKVKRGAVRAFLDNGADVNAQTHMGVTALTGAISENADAAILQDIIDSGADINHQLINPVSGNKGVSALMVSVFDDSKPEITKILIDNGADIKVRTYNGVNMLIAAANFDKNIELVKTAIKEGFDVNAKTTRGITALINAARNNTGTEIIEILMENGADTKVRDVFGKTALDYLELNERMPKKNKVKAEKLLKKK